MIYLYVALGCVAILVAPLAILIRILALRVLSTQPRRKALEARGVGKSVQFPSNDQTTAVGRYGLWFGENFEQHALVGAVNDQDLRKVVRQVVKSTAAVPTEPFIAQLTGHTLSGPADIDPNWQNVDVPLRDGTSAPAWLFPGASAASRWVIHIQGIRTSRRVALRSVEVVERAGLTSLVITYRGAGDGPSEGLSALGQREWTDLADAIGYARAHGAVGIDVVAWSMGAGLAFELLRRDPQAFDRLALIAPATDWSGIVQHGIQKAGLPSFLAPVVSWAMGSDVASRLIGMSSPLDFRRLNWSENFWLTVPTLVLHSRGDDEIPFHLTEVFASNHETVSLVETASAPHGWEANVDPERFESTLAAWLDARYPNGTQ